MDVAQDIGNYSFGLDGDKLVSELRRFADDIEAGKTHPQSVMEIITNKKEDFTTRRLVITYVKQRGE